MKIKSIKASNFELPSSTISLLSSADKERRSKDQGESVGGGDRKAWFARDEVANPMSRYPRFKSHRNLWLPSWSQTVCVVVAEDGTYGVGMTSYGTPVNAVINEHFAPLLVGEDCMAIERLWDMMFRLSSP